MKRLTVTLIVMGFSGMAAQLLFLRELLTVFYGNELSIGLILSGWLLMEAAGAYAVRRPAKRLREIDRYVLVQFLFAVCLPVSLYAARVVKRLLEIPPGEGAGFGALALAAFGVLLPVCLTHGALFTSGCRLFAGAHKEEAESGAGGYMLEALGTLAGAVCVTFSLIPFFHSFQTALAVSALNLLLCVVLLRGGGIGGCEAGGSIARVLTRVCAAGGAAALVLLLIGGADAIHRRSIAQQWEGLSVVLVRNSIYENIAVVSQAGQYTFFTGGLPAVTVPDPDTASIEARVHFPLLFHPAPERVLLLSGGAGGAIRETLRHPVKMVNYVELDPDFLQTILMFPTSLTLQELSDERVNVIEADGRRYLKEAPLPYDAILVGRDLPSDLQSNRLFTLEFFQLAARQLRPNGILSLTLPGSHTYLNQELKRIHRSILTTLESVFETVHVIPGDITHYLAQRGSDEWSADILSARFRERDLDTQLLDPAYIAYRLQERRLHWFSESLESARAVRNLDFSPVAVFYSLRYWNAMFSPAANALLDSFECPAGAVWRLALGLVVLMALLGGGELLWFRRRAKASAVLPGIAVIFTTLTSGFAGMVFDIALIFTFQALYGYVFFWIGILISVYMAGAAAGSRLVLRSLRCDRCRIPLLLRLDGAVLGFIALLALAFLVPERPIVGLPDAGVKTLFLAFGLVAGMLSGAQYSAAVDLYQRWTPPGNNQPSSAGLIYTADLAGGCAGGLIAGVILLPLLGLSGTLAILLGLKMVSVGALAAIIRIKGGPIFR